MYSAERILQKNLEKFIDLPEGMTVKPEIIHNTENYVIYLRKGGNTLGFCQLSVVPACCGTLFLSNLNAYERGQGHAKRLLDIATRIAELCGYSSLDCIIPSVEGTTGPARPWGRAHSIFTKNGFKEMKGYKVKNDRTGHLLHYYQKQIKSLIQYNQPSWYADNSNHFQPLTKEQ